ncbi:MAG: hypothetical protein WCI74_07180 [Actinomycetes bacterium]
MYVPKASKVALGVAASLIVAGLGINAAQALTGSNPVNATPGFSADPGVTAGRVQVTDGR